MAVKHSIATYLRKINFLPFVCHCDVSYSVSVSLTSGVHKSWVNSAIPFILRFKQTIPGRGDKPGFGFRPSNGSPAYPEKPATLAFPPGEPAFLPQSVHSLHHCCGSGTS